MKKSYKKYLAEENSLISDVFSRIKTEKKQRSRLVPKNSQEAMNYVQHMLADADEIGKKQLKKYKCKSCGNEFYYKYRRDYCPDFDNACYKNEKALRQSVVDGLAAEIKKGLYANYKIFREYLPESGQTKIDYDLVLRKRFDEDAFYGTYRVGELKWRVVKDYYFFIEHKDDNRFLHIYKK